MIRIAIVDDEEPFRDRIEEIASGALSGETAETEIKKYPDGVCFYEAVSAGETFDILLADIQDGRYGRDGAGAEDTERESGIGYHFCHLL